MIRDATLSFSNAQALTTTAASTSVIDLLGVGSGVASQNIIGNVSVFGEDIGVGDGPNNPKLLVLVTTTLAGGTSVNVQLQGAIDNGSNAPGSYVTYAESSPILTANLVAGTSIWEVDVAAVIPKGAVNGPLPRFLRLNYVIVGTYTSGNVTAEILLHRFDYTAKMYPSNYVVA